MREEESPCLLPRLAGGRIFLPARIFRLTASSGRVGASRACRQDRPFDRLSGRRPRVLAPRSDKPRSDRRSTVHGRRKSLKYSGLQWFMLAENNPAPSTSRTHPPPPLEPPDEPPPREPTTAPSDRGAQLARLGDRIAALSARIQAATHELLVLIREFDEREGWDGCLTCAHWLSWRAGLSPGAAREHVRVARALGELPKLSDAMRRGKVSYSKVRAVTRVATPKNEQTLLGVALAGTAAHVERIARAWRRIDRNVEQAEDRRRAASRGLRTWVDEDGMVVVRGRLTPELGAVLRRALEAACDQARRGTAGDGGGKGEAADASSGAERGNPGRVVRRGRTDARAAAGGRHQDGGGSGIGGRTRSGDGRRPVSGGAARGRGGAGGNSGRSRGNVWGRSVGTGAASRRRPRSRGNAGGRARGVPRFPRRIPDTHGSAGPGRTRPSTATAPHVRLVSGGTAGDGCRPPDRAGRGGGHPRLRGDRAAPGLRRGHGQHAPRPRRRDPRCRPPHPDHLASAAPGAGGPRPAVPVPGLRQRPLRCPICRYPDYADVRPDPPVVQGVCDETIGIIIVR